MPQIKSAIKRMRTSAKAQIRNYQTRSQVHTAVKKVRDLVQSGDLKGAQAALAQAYKTLDTAAKKHVIHQNNAARRKSRLNKLIVSKLKK